MKNNSSVILWFLVAFCFIITGALSKDIVFIILGCASICLGCSNIKKDKVNKDK